MKQGNIILSLNSIPLSLTNTWKPHVVKKAMEPTLAQGALRTRNHTTTSPPSPKKPRRYATSIFFSPVTPSPTTTSGISKSPKVKISYSLIELQLLDCLSAYGCKFRTIFCTTNSMKSWTDPASSSPWVTQTLPRMPEVTLRNVWRHFLEYLPTFP